jgi:hypothetical protein
MKVHFPLTTFGFQEVMPVGAPGLLDDLDGEAARGNVLDVDSQGFTYIGLYGGDAKLLGESLEYVQRTATQILNAIGADDSSAPPV